MRRLPKVILGLLSLGHLTYSHAEWVTLHIDFVNLSSQSTTISLLWPTKTDISATVPPHHTVSEEASAFIYRDSYGQPTCSDVKKMIVWKNGQWQCTADFSLQSVLDSFYHKNTIRLIKTPEGCCINCK